MKHLLFIISFSIVSTVSAQDISAFINKTDRILKDIVVDSNVDYAKAKKNQDLRTIAKEIETFNIEGLTKNEQQAFLINAYNLIVINQATQAYPIQSVQDVGGFFNRTKHLIAGSKMTLNELETKHLLKVYEDPRFHFVLVCGAKGCPVITNEAYSPERLDLQLKRQTLKAINDPNFIYEKGGSVYVSQIFNWYPGDFNGKSNIIPFINKYKDEKVSTSASLKYYDYDWSLNDASSTGNIGASSAQGANAFRYVVSAAIPQGGVELKLFNNLYTQRTGDTQQLFDRSNFFTSSFSALYGVTNRFNAGLEVRYRRVSNVSLPSNPLNVFESGPASTHRSGITAIGPRVRFAPFKKLKDFSVQSTLSFPVGSALEGDGTRPFIDWNAATFNTQFFNDRAIGSNFSLFTEIDILIEDIGGENGLNRFSTPVTAILSYFPNPKTTFYVLGSYSPYWQSDFDYFYQAGLGAKYQISPSFEVELLATKFANQFLIQNNGNAATYNIGFRYSY